jgi:hypothetical protein
MRLIIAAMMTVLLAGSAGAQSVNLPLQQDRPSMSEEDRAKQEAADKAYKSATEKIQQKSGASDPWANVRAAEQPQNNAKKPRAGAK